MSYIMLAHDDHSMIASFKVAAREAGHRSDGTQAPAIIYSLGGRLSPYYWRNGLHTLAQLGAVEALPIFRHFMEARLVAEARSREIPDEEHQAAVKVREFSRELDRTHATLFTSSTGPVTYPVAVYALRQIADMVYHGNYAHYSNLPDVVLTHFREDYGSALNMRLSPMPRLERLRTLIEKLAHRQVLRGETYHDIQLVVNEGQAAGQLVAAKLEEMEAGLEKYPRIGFSALFSILRGLGDTHYEPLVGRFRDGNSVIHCTNAVYWDIRDGIPVTLVSAY